jgi:hypothetical protein
MSEYSETSEEVETTHSGSGKEPVSVTMEDGRVVKFPPRRRSIRTIWEDAEGQLHARVDFDNGRIVSLDVPEWSIKELAARGVELTFSPLINAPDSTDQAVDNVEELVERFNSGDRSIFTKANSVPSLQVSILAQALFNYWEAAGKPKDLEVISRWLKEQNHSAKLKLRKSAEIKPFVDALEAQKRPVKRDDTAASALLESLLAA